MKFMDICTKKTFDKNGEQVTQWLKVGTMRIVDGEKMFIELNMFPSTSFYVFEQKPKETGVSKFKGSNNPSEMATPEGW